MEFGVQSRGSFADMLALARWAEDRGLACFAMPDHYLTSSTDAERPAYDNLTMLAGLARETQRIRLATLVSPITFRHPAVLAKNAVTIDEMSEGRFTLGVGTGWLEREHDIFGIPFPPGTERWERLEEALGYLRAVFTPGGGFEGQHYRLEPLSLQPAPSAGLQLVVGGTGPRRTPMLAGRFADEYNAYPEPRDELRRRIDTARTAADDAGRAGNALLVSSSGLMAIGRNDAEYRRSLERIAGALNRSPEQLEEGFAAKEAPHGTVQQVRDLLGTLQEAGVTRFYLQALPDHSLDELDELLEMVSG